MDLGAAGRGAGTPGARTAQGRQRFGRRSPGSAVGSSWPHPCKGPASCEWPPPAGTATLEVLDRSTASTRLARATRQYPGVNRQRFPTIRQSAPRVRRTFIHGDRDRPARRDQSAPTGGGSQLAKPPALARRVPSRAGMPKEQARPALRCVPRAAQSGPRGGLTLSGRNARAPPSAARTGAGRELGVRCARVEWSRTRHADVSPFLIS